MRVLSDSQNWKLAHKHISEDLFWGSEEDFQRVILVFVTVHGCMHTLSPHVYTDYQQDIQNFY